MTGYLGTSKNLLKEPLCDDLNMLVLQSPSLLLFYNYPVTMKSWVKVVLKNFEEVVSIQGLI